MFRNYKLVRSEVTVGKHRFDFLLESPKGNPFYLEIKSVTYVENGIAQFPDAVTERGARHATALAELAAQGNKAYIKHSNKLRKDSRTLPANNPVIL